uniref:hypothetical protein n=1 Tax=Flavobacterium psychrophilum TaxID=96345 RepID=UPI0031391201
HFLYFISQMYYLKFKISLRFIKGLKYDGILEILKLKEKKSSMIPEIRYELRSNDIVLIIYGDFIEIVFELTLDYFHLLELNKKNELKEIELFKTFFNQLKSLGIDEVHFGIFAEFEKDEGFTYCWKNIYRIMSKYDNYFKLEI